MAFNKPLVNMFIVIVLVCISACTTADTESGVITAQDVIGREQPSEWDLVILGDSDMWLSYEYYVPLFEQDLGIPIHVHDKTAPPNSPPAIELRGDQELQNLVSEADIVIFNIPFVGPAVGGACFDQNRSFEEAECFDVSLNEYSQWTLDMFTEIKELVGSEGVMIRLQNMFIPLRYWQRNLYLEKRLDTCLECFSAYWDAQAEISEAEGIPLVDVFTLFHGPDGDQDPYALGYFDSDPIHVNDEGAKAIAELYRSVGYEYWLPK